MCSGRVYSRIGYISAVRLHNIKDLSSVVSWKLHLGLRHGATDCNSTPIDTLVFNRTRTLERIYCDKRCAG